MRPHRSNEPGFESVDFRRGDPCAVQNPACAYDVARAHCVDFAQVAACPATLDEARETNLFCTHPEQSALDCQYEGHWCTCHRGTQYCGGAAPHPAMFNNPVPWGCQADLDPQGCPTRGAIEGERCSPNGQVCEQGCYLIMECRRRRWRVKEHLPPRP